MTEAETTAKHKVQVKKFPVMEIFGPTVQGEGVLCGHVSHFVRFGGCGYRCTWCDSMHAVDPQLIKANARRMTAEEIADEVNDLSAAPWVTLSGGDPLMFDLYNVVVRLINLGFRTAVETQGQLYKPWVTRLNQVTVSPKPPSSGMQDKLDHDVLEQYLFSCPSTIFKVPIFDVRDLNWAQELHVRYSGVPMYLSAGTPAVTGRGNLVDAAAFDVVQSLRFLTAEMLRRPELSDCIVLPQMHVLVWGHQRGV